MAIKLFTTSRITKDLSADQLEVLFQEFRRYKEIGSYMPYLGRDFLYDRPDSAISAELQHVHVHPNFLTGRPVNNLTNNLKTWRLNGSQRDRRSDTCLVYCQGSYSDANYLLIAFLKEDAHKIANKVTAIGVLADEAERFRQKY